MSTRPLLTRLAAAATAALALAAGHAGAQALGDYSLVSLGNATLTGSSIAGGVAVGGDARIQSQSIQAGAAGVVVGGDLAFVSGSIGGDTTVGGDLVSSYSGSFGGDVYVGGTLDASAGLSAAGTTMVWGPTTGVQPWYPRVASGAGEFSLGLDFAAEQAQLAALSARLAATAAGGAVDVWGTLHFDATGQPLAVFQIDAADAARNMQIDGLAEGAAVVINVAGASVDFGSHGWTGFGSGQVLFNLPDATWVRISGEVAASLLAPGATVQPGWGVIDGQALVASWTSNAQIRGNTYTGVLAAAPVPEPHTWALMGAGLLVIGRIARRRLG